MKTVGVLALQGGFAAHAAALADCGCLSREVRTPADLDGLAGLVLPGGESPAQLRLLAASGLDRVLPAFVRSGVPVLATCAGLILLADEVQNPAQPSLGALPIAVERNGYGRQLDSQETRSDSGRPVVLIRAPRITRIADEVKILDHLGGEPILVRHGNVVGATFHPELSADRSLYHDLFD